MEIASGHGQFAKGRVAVGCNPIQPEQLEIGAPVPGCEQTVVAGGFQALLPAGQTKAAGL